MDVIEWQQAYRYAISYIYVHSMERNRWIMMNIITWYDRPVQFTWYPADGMFYSIRTFQLHIDQYQIVWMGIDHCRSVALFQVQFCLHHVSPLTFLVTLLTDTMSMHLRQQQQGNQVGSHAVLCQRYSSRGICSIISHPHHSNPLICTWFLNEQQLVCIMPDMNRLW